MSELKSMTGTLVRSVRRPPRVKSPRGPLDRLPAFRNEGECGGSEPDLFHPEGGSGLEAMAALRAQVEEAKTICRRCPVIGACRDWALSHAETGIWGGMTEKERYDLLHPKAPRKAQRPQKPRRAAKTGAATSGLAAPVEGAQGGTVAAGGTA